MIPSALRLHTALALALPFVACNNDPPPATDGDGTGTDSDHGTSPTASGSDAADDTGTSSTTGDSTPACSARRHSLLFDDHCGRIAFGDLDADGEHDLLVVSDPETFISVTGDKRLYAYIGDDPLLGAPEIHCCFEAGDTRSATMLDVNEDGRDDPVLAVQQNVTTGDVGQGYEDLELWIRGPQGGFLGRQPLARLPDVFAATPSAATGALHPTRPALALADGQLLGMAVADGIAMVPPEDRIMLGADIRALVTLDLDVDGLDDVVALLDSQLILVHNDGDATFSIESQSVPPLTGSSLLRGDLDGDARPELLLVGAEGLAVGRLDGGDPSWSTQGLVPEGPAALSDVDGDGTLDLVTTAGAELVAHLGAGDGTFAAAPMPLSTGVGEDVRDVGAGDLDGDGTAELVVCDEQGILVVTP